MQTINTVKEDEVIETQTQINANINIVKEDEAN